MQSTRHCSKHCSGVQSSGGSPINDRRRKHDWNLNIIRIACCQPIDMPCRYVVVIHVSAYSQNQKLPFSQPPLSNTHVVKYLNKEVFVFVLKLCFFNNNNNNNKTQKAFFGCWNVVVVVDSSNSFRLFMYSSEFQSTHINRKVIEEWRRCVTGDFLFSLSSRSPKFCLTARKCNTNSTFK